jgi:hypothetical protein
LADVHGISDIYAGRNVCNAPLSADGTNRHRVWCRRGRVCTDSNTIERLRYSALTHCSTVAAQSICGLTNGSIVTEAKDTTGGCTIADCRVVSTYTK